ncbi:MAG: protein kinase [Planctomycetes bacterium]|nr:protein kinase [Planctomycetota bacterium]
MATVEPTPQIPGYTLHELLGAGTSGRVYRALRSANGDVVAVKVLQGPLDPRFAREVAILEALDHPHLLKILDHGSTGEHAFLVTELVTGTTLGELLPLRALGPVALAQTVAKIADALGVAHDASVLHRDVKPANVLLDSDLEPRLIDFGLATFVEDAGMLTRSGTSVGTPMYMAPEVLVGGSKCGTAASDVYALGVMLFEGLTAKHPFQGLDWRRTVERILSGQPPSTAGIPSWIQATCLAALSSDPAQRPEAKALARLLLAALPASEGSASLPTPSPLEPPPQRRGVGSRLGPYVLEELLGEGGMGAVFLARHEVTNAQHALKVVNSGRPERRARFEAEALALAKVDAHPGVVGIHLLEHLDHNQSFFALEYVPGTDLARELKQGPLEIERAVRIGRQVADALAHVHAQGIVHRDVKPANILLHADDDRALLADFGLALDPEEARLTASNAILGTPCFMAPEQARGGRAGVGPKADVFSLGAVLYAMLVGEAPFQRPHFVAILEALLESAPAPLRRARTDVPPALEELILWALEKDPQDRPDARELVDALDFFQRSGGFSRTGSPRSGLGRLARRVGGPRLALLTALGLIALCAGGLTFALSARSEARTAWEGEAREEIASAELALARKDKSGLAAYYDWESAAPAPNPDWQNLTALEALEREDVGSDLVAKVGELAGSLRAARLRAQTEAALGRGNLDQAQALLGELSPAGAEVFGALIQARRGEAFDLQALRARIEHLPGWAADRLRLLVARLELDRGQGEVSRALLSNIAPERRGAANQLLAEVSVRDALSAAEAGDLRGVEQGFAQARVLAPARAAAGYTRAAAGALRAWRSGAKAASLVPLLEVLNGPGGRVPETAPIYVAAAVDTSHTQRAEVGLLSAQSLERALRLSPAVEFPQELLAWLSFQAGLSLERGDLWGAVQIYRVCTRGGMRFVGVGFTALATIHERGLLERPLRADPEDWASRAWRGFAAYGAYRAGEGSLAHSERLELAQRAYDDFERCLERVEVQGQLRAEFEILQLKCAAALGAKTLREGIEEIEARTDFPDLWHVYRIGAVFYCERDPQLGLRYARRYLEEVRRRLEATAKGRLRPQEWGVDAQRLEGAFIALLSSLIACGRIDEARDLLEESLVRSSLEPEALDDFKRKLGTR